MTKLNHASRMSYGSRNLLCLGIEPSQSYPSGRPSGSRSAYLFSILDCSRPDFLRFHMQPTQRFTLRMAASKPTTLFAKTKTVKELIETTPIKHSTEDSGRPAKARIVPTRPCLVDR